MNITHTMCFSNTCWLEQVPYFWEINFNWINRKLALTKPVQPTFLAYYFL